MMIRRVLAGVALMVALLGPVSDAFALIGTINATAIWRARPSGNNANGGGYDPGITSPGTDYSQQDSPQVTFDGATILAVTAGASATITITGYTVASTDVANVLHIIGGTNFTAGWYYVQSVNTGTNTWTLDRNVATGVGAAMTGRMGGGWRDFWTNPTIGATNPTVGGNIIYVLGGASPSIGSPDYPGPASFVTYPAYNGAGLQLRIIGDPNTPANNGFAGKPVFAPTGIFVFGGGGFLWQNLWVVIKGTNFNNHAVFEADRGSNTFVGVVFDQNGYEQFLVSGDGGVSSFKIIGSEAYSSAATRGSNASGCFQVEHFGADFWGNNFHNLLCQNGVITTNTPAVVSSISNTIIAKNAGPGIVLTAPSMFAIINNTIDANGGDNIKFSAQTDVAQATILCNILSNAPSGKYGINAATGTTAANDLFRGFIDYNTFYGNNADLNALSYGAHDTHGGSDPYVGQSTQNYTLTASPTPCYPSAAFPQHQSGQTTTVRAYNYPGAVQPNSTSAATVMATSNAYPNAAFPQHTASQTTTVQDFVYPGAVQPGPPVLSGPLFFWAPF